MVTRKIVLIAKPGGTSTGVGRYVQMLHHGLDAARVDAARIAPSAPPLPNAVYALLRRFRIDVRTFLTNYPIWATYPKADVYHLTSQNLATLLLFHPPKGKVVVTVHDIIPYMLRNNPRLSTYHHIADRIFDRLAMAGLGRADHLIAVSQFTKQCMVEQLGIAPEKISVIYYGIDHACFRPLPVSLTIRERYGLPEGHRYLIYVGSDDPRKNLATLVRALALLREKIPNVELIKVGRAHFNQERARLIEFATKLGVRTAIHFLEDVLDDLPLLYNLADVCVMPSLYEGFGFPTLEAMTCGTPVVCANSASLPEVSGYAALLFENGTNAVDNLANQLLRVLTNHELSLSMRSKAKARAAAFDWGKATRETIHVYENIKRETQAPQQTFQNHIVERSLDLVLDPRLPHAASSNLYRLWRYALPRSLPQLNEPLLICLTFDIEHDFRDPASMASSERFLPRYIDWAREHGWSSTLYVQGNLIPCFSDLLHEAKQNHELGLHGMHHEVWGRSRWWQYSLGLVGLSEVEKRNRLLQALELFERAKLEQPRSFRAPYLNADRNTLRLLAHNGFTSDSSPATYFGAEPIPRQYNGIWQVPVTANPRPEWNRRGVRFHELILGTMRTMTNEQIIGTVSMAVHLQQERGLRLPPHLVLLAHPWEFESIPGVSTASESNWEFLDGILNKIAEIYPVNFIKMSDLISRLSTLGTLRK